MSSLPGTAYDRTIVIMLFLTTLAPGALIPSAPALQSKQAKVTASPAAHERTLRAMAEKISKAVLDKDVSALLAYDRADLRANDEVSLQNPKSDLYCYLFDSACITWGDGSWRSVYDKISQAQALQIKVKLARLPADHQLYGSLLFYDGSSVSEKELQSSEFLCKEAPEKVASWKFRLEKGKWKAVTPLFDAETKALCQE